MNELLLFLSFMLIYGGVAIAYALFDKVGLVVFSVFALVMANIEVSVLIKAFGMEQTLGNVLFAATFLITDALSELSGKNIAKRALKIAVFFNVFFLVLVQLWLHYIPIDALTGSSLQKIFTQTPRIICVSLVVFVVAMLADIWLYHLWWKITETFLGSKEKWLWLRNNASTFISLLLNTFLFNVGAFYGVYDWNVIFEIIISSYLIFAILALLDTPVLYGIVYISKWKKNHGYKT